MYGVLGSTVAWHAALDCYPCNCWATDQRGLMLRECALICSHKVLPWHLHLPTLV